ncbi:unnamed protein product [Oreochromis niloticus]|nr:unnamed protein product [Mustela putorius furo]
MPPRVVENDRAKILWDFQMQTDKMVVANQPDIVVVDKQKKTAVVIDVAVPNDSNIRKKEHEKLEKYQGLREELERMWRVKVTVVPVVIGALETDWNIFEHQDLETFTGSVLDYIKFCTANVTVDKSIRVFPNQKPWMTSEVRSLLKARDATFRSGDRALYRAARADLKRAIKKAKSDHKRNIESHLSSNNTRETELMFLQVSGKRTMLLSNEARREIAKQARAVKEERRAALGAQHKYLMSRLADAGSLDEAAVEDAIVSDDRPLLVKCLFFLRTTEKAITTANVQQEVNFGVLDCSGSGGILNSLETLLTHIMLPALRSQQSWGSVQDGTSCPHVQSFLSSVDQFVSNLSSARLNMERKFQLQHVELPDAISQLSSPADYRAAANNSELVEHLEEVLTLWTNQIKQVLTEREQMRKEADDVGPSAELEHWKSRTVTFNR